MIDPLTVALNIGKSLLTRVWPDPKEQAEQLFKLEELYSKGDSEKLSWMASCYWMGRCNIFSVNVHTQGARSNLHLDVSINSYSKRLGWRISSDFACVSRLGSI